MKIAAVYSVFNEEEYLVYSIRSVRAHVDWVIVNVNQRPWSRNGAASGRSYALDRTEAIVRDLAKTDPNIILRSGQCANEVAHRQAGMEQCWALGADYYFLVDGDEVYRPDHLQALREEIQTHPEVGTFYIKCHIFWRSFRYRIPAEVMRWTPWRVFKIDRLRRWGPIRWPYRTRFIGDNKTNSLGPRYLIPPSRCVFYHFSYARSEEKMRQKITTFSVADQVKTDWFDRVWLAWPSQRQMRNIHPMVPEEFPIAQPVDPVDLPDVMTTHPYHAVEMIR